MQEQNHQVRDKICFRGSEAKIQDAIFKYSGRKREKHDAKPATHLWCPGAARVTRVAGISAGISC